MKKILTMFCIMVLVVGCGKVSKVESQVSFNDGNTDPKLGELHEISNRMTVPMTELGLEMIESSLAGEPKGNVLVSPLSLWLALDMLQNGADGETKNEIFPVIGYSAETEDLINNDSKAIISYLNSQNTDYLGLSIANSMWMKEDRTFQAEFVDVLAGYYDAQAYNVDFSDEATINHMNQWVEEQTNGMLKETIKQLDEETLLVLMNTLYFKGEWVHEFYEDSTRKKEFYVTENVVNQVDMMRQQEFFQYYEDELSQVVYMPYKFSMDMIVVLPKDDVGAWMERLTAEDLQGVMSGEESERRDVELSFPKFEFEAKNNLNEMLVEMGMVRAFDEEAAEFSKIIEEDEQVWVNKIFQNAKIVVDEYGTEAAAVTVIDVNATSAMEPMEPVVMNCNRPFVFIIRENVTGMPLFMGVFSGDK